MISLTFSLTAERLLLSERPRVPLRFPEADFCRHRQSGGTGETDPAGLPEEFSEAVRGYADIFENNGFWELSLENVFLCGIVENAAKKALSVNEKTYRNGTVPFLTEYCLKKKPFGNPERELLRKQLETDPVARTLALAVSVSEGPLKLGDRAEILVERGPLIRLLPKLFWIYEAKRENTDAFSEILCRGVQNAIRENSENPEHFADFANS